MYVCLINFTYRGAKVVVVLLVISHLSKLCYVINSEPDMDKKRCRKIKQSVLHTILVVIIREID